MKYYSIAYSKTDGSSILEDHHPIAGISVKWDRLETKENIVDLLNEKEKRIDELEKENKMLKEYSEELEVHVPKETLRLVKKYFLKGD